MITETVTVETPGGVDRWGDPLPATTRRLAGCMFSPRGSDEGRGAAGFGVASPNTVITGLTLYAPAESGIRPVDVIVRADGTRWQVVGEPGEWRSPFTGWLPGDQVALTRVVG